VWPSCLRAAWGGFIRAAKDIAENGRFDAFADLPTMADITGAFADKGYRNLLWVDHNNILYMFISLAI
jgi:hypothetical protein